jgi:hypothetical protein
MSRVSCFFLTGFLFAGAVCAEDKPAPKWEEFKSEPGRFSVQLPGKPSEQVRTAKTSGGMVMLHFFTVQTDKVAYMVGYVDYPAATVQEQGPDTLLEGNRDSFIATVKGKLNLDKKITLDGNPGREITVETDQGPKFRLREFVVKERVYQVLARSSDLTQPEVARFEDSFKLLPDK